MGVTGATSFLPELFADTIVEQQDFQAGGRNNATITEKNCTVLFAAVQESGIGLWPPRRPPASGAAIEAGPATPAYGRRGRV